MGEVMSLGAINAFLNDQKVAPGFDRKADQAPGHDKANMAAADNAAVTHLSSMSYSQLSMKVMSSSFQQNMSGVGNMPAMPMPPEQAEQKDSFFDFEAITKNVLSFVETAMNMAAANGADKDELNGLLGKARKGVEDGIGQARDMLTDFMKEGDEIDEGIKKAEEGIFAGLDNINDQLNDPERDQIGAFNYRGIEQSTSYQASNSAALSLTTADGDEVSISFESLIAYQEQMRLQQMETGFDDGENQGYMYSESAEYSQASFAQDKFAFSVKGELDEDELKAIGELVKDVSDLADEFFNGDVQAAFEKAQELGFDESEISSMSLDLQRSESISVSQAYREVAAYQQNQAPESTPASLPQSVQQPLKEYAENLLDMMNKADQQLADQDQIQSIVDQIFERQFELQGNELMEAMNHFNHFNRQILGSAEPQPAAKTES